MRGRCRPNGELAVALLVLGTAAIGLSACGTLESGTATPLGDSTPSTTSSTTTTSTVLPTTTTLLNPLLMSCVDFVQFEAYVGDPYWQQVWFDLDESEVALGAWCADFSESDSTAFAAMNREYQAIVAYLAGSDPALATATTPAVVVVMVPPPVEEPITTPTEPPPVTEPPVTEPPVTEPPVTEPPVTDPPVTDPPTTPEPPPAAPETSPPEVSVAPTVSTG